jgi:hypothetical protein
MVKEFADYAEGYRRDADAEDGTPIDAEDGTPIHLKQVRRIQ